jgi:hypothetical protein
MSDKIDYWLQAVACEVEREKVRQLAIKLIHAGFRTLAKENHPDIGGSHTSMQRLSSLRDALLTSHAKPRLPRTLRTAVDKQFRKQNGRLQ